MPATMARYMAHSDAIYFTEDQLNFWSINAQIESELLKVKAQIARKIDECKSK